MATAIYKTTTATARWIFDCDSWNIDNYASGWPTLMGSTDPWLTGESLLPFPPLHGGVIVSWIGGASDGEYVWESLRYRDRSAPPWYPEYYFPIIDYTDVVFHDPPEGYAFDMSGIGTPSPRYDMTYEYAVWGWGYWGSSTRYCLELLYKRDTIRTIRWADPLPATIVPALVGVGFLGGLMMFCSGASLPPLGRRRRKS